jgi:DNA-binding transcriptional regulator LsrR (DeoR family)
LYVVAAPGIENENDANVRSNAFRSFGMSAAGIVASHIDEVDMCCVAWGRTIAATVDFLPTNNSPSNRKKQFIPIAGEPTNHEPNGIAPSDAARRLSLAWPGSTSLSLRGVQARIPKSVYDHDDGKIAGELIRFSTNYRRIFEPSDSGEPPLISEVPMILTGVGNVDTSRRSIGVSPDPMYLETVEAEEPNILDLAVGNIGGVWIAKNEISDEDKELVAKVNKRWLGAQYSDFRGCALNADLQERRPGVVVVAAEPDKADIVLETLHLINVLIVSRQLADELGHRLPLS